MSHQEPMFQTSSKNQNLYLQGLFKEFLKLFKYFFDSPIHMIVGLFDLIFNALQLERKRRKRRVSNKVYMSTLRCDHSSLVYKH